MSILNSDPNGSKSRTQNGKRWESKDGSRRRRFVTYVILIVVFGGLYGFLYENERPWLDWFFGKDNWYKPSWIVLLAIILLGFTVGCLLKNIGLLPNNRALKDHHNQEDRNPRQLENLTSEGSEACKEVGPRDRENEDFRRDSK
jgi:hypothetical protein